MARLNNFSVLPWYDFRNEQDFRHWWVYGHIYPLYGSKDGIIPSQLSRASLDGYNPKTRIFSGSALSNTAIDEYGNLVTATGSTCWNFGDISAYDGETLMIVNKQIVENGMSWTILDDGSPIDYGNGDTLIVNLGGGTTTLVVQWKSGQSELWLMSDTEAPLLPTLMEAYTPDGAFVASVWKPGLWAAKRVGSVDYLVSTTSAFSTSLPEGQYYFKLSDGTNTWYSDVFTAISSDNLHRLVLVRWYDDTDFVMDAGRIVYVSPSYQNELYLRAEIAKPKYEFEENGDTRDGVFYPTKLISKKVYQMHTLAPEYLLDVMRLIRMADHVVVCTWDEEGNPYPMDAAAFLITPEWEAEGDVAGVAIEFETDTIAKKIGLAYIR